MNIIEQRLRAMLAPYTLIASGEYGDGLKSDCERIIRQLLLSEFSGLKEHVFPVLVRSAPESFDAMLRWFIGKFWLILINVRCWARDKNFSQNGGLERLLRHELLHLETKRPDRDPVFQAELRRRAIY